MKQLFCNKITKVKVCDVLHPTWVYFTTTTLLKTIHANNGHKYNTRLYADVSVMNNTILRFGCRNGLSASQ